MFLNYLSLALLILGVIALIYLFIYIHDIPHMVAKKRDHPQAEAIHIACWLSLFTLHALWPLVFIWAVSKPPKIHLNYEPGEATSPDELQERIRQIQRDLNEVQNQLSQQTAGKGA
jgi:type VI protein secretion system component VasK